MFKQVGCVVTLGAVVFAGCQGSSVSRRSAEIPKRPTALALHTTTDNAESRMPPKVKVGSKPASDVRLVGGDDDDLVDTTSLPAALSSSLLSLDEAIERALVENPDMVAVRQAEGVSAAAYGVAETYPFNPFVQARATPYQQGSEPNINTVFHYILLQQNIQLAHQQQFREEIAASQLNQVRWNIHNFELLNAAQTTRLYLTALYQKGIRDLTRKNADLNEQLLQISERREEAGDITKADLAIVRMDSRSTRQQANLAEATYQTALLDLRRQLNIPLEKPIELREDLTALRWKPAHEAALSQMSDSDAAMDFKFDGDSELIKRLADGRPDLMAARADVETARAACRLANAARVPDVQFGPFYQVDEFGTRFFGFQGQMDVPVINTGKPLARQRAAEHGQRTVTWQQLQVRAELEAAAAVDRYERARRLVEASRPDMQSDLPAELQRLEAQFKEQEVDVLRIFQGRTSLIQNRRAVLEMLNELAQATAAVTATTGVFPRSLLTAGDPVPPPAP